MLHHIKKSLGNAVLAIGLLTNAAAAHAGDKGYFGFAMSVDADSFSFNPTLKSVTVDKVAPGSPAESAGLVKGDQFVEVEGRVVAGSKANDLKPHLSKNVGETINLKVRKASGEIVQISLTAARKP